MKKNIVNFPLQVLVLTLLLGCHPKLRQDLIGDKASSRVTLLISMDGFRNDYLDSFDTPNLDQIAQHGLQAEALIPVFPTKTFPNHYSIVTGLYPEDHGIAANKMYDREKDSWFQIGAGSKATREAYWFEGEPIWVTAKKQGVKTATLFWPGSDATPDSLKPDYHFYYDNNFNHAARIAQVLDWLKMPENQRPKLITLYFESPDLEGHRFGPFSPETEKAVERMDALMGGLMRKIEELDMKGQVNIVITSDHGMAQLSPDSVIFIDDYIDLQDVMFVQTSPKADIIPAPGRDSIVYFQLKDAHPHLSVFRKGDEPDRWHYRKHRRITPLIAVADLGWTIMHRREFALKQKSLQGGAHGYDNRNPEMWAVFMASGPDFKAGQKMAAFENIEIYNLLCRLLRISPTSNSGDSTLFIPYLK